MIEIENIKACENQLLQAMKNTDLETLDQLLYDGLLFNGPNGETITKSIDLNAYRSGNMLVKELNISNQQINIIHDNAIVAVSVEMKGEFMKQPIAGKFRYIRVWKLINNQLKVIGGGCTPLA